MSQKSSGAYSDAVTGPPAVDDDDVVVVVVVVISGVGATLETIAELPPPPPPPPPAPTLTDLGRLEGIFMNELSGAAGARCLAHAMMAACAISVSG